MPRVHGIDLHRRGEKVIERIEPHPKEELDGRIFGNGSFSVSAVSISSAGNDNAYGTTATTRRSAVLTPSTCTAIAGGGSLAAVATAAFDAAASAARGGDNDVATPWGNRDADQSNTAMQGQDTVSKKSTPPLEKKKKKQTRANPTNDNLNYDDDTEFQFKYEDEDDSSVTTMGEDDGSIDLLQEDGATNNNNDDKSKNNATKNKPTNHLHHSNLTIAPSPISPATQTLDRLSQIGSQEQEEDRNGGSVSSSFHLLATAATNKWEEQNGKTEEEEDDQVDKCSAMDGKGETKSSKDYKLPDNNENSDEEESDDSDEDDHDASEDSNPGSSQNRIKESSHEPQRGDNQDAIMKKQRIIKDLKDYFMSTKNSSDYAKTANQEAPLVQFCHSCNNPAASHLPHHGLCPKHADFYNSGSYEILCILVDGFGHKCEACMFQYDNGRPNKKLEHAQKCNRNIAKKNPSKASENSSQPSTTTQASYPSWKTLHKQVSLTTAARSGCRKCKRELRGEKSSIGHDIQCPRRLPPRQNHGVSLPTAAKSGCKKCERELKSGEKSSKGHDIQCPRRQRPRPNRSPLSEEPPKDHPTLSEGAASGCHKCCEKVRTGQDTIWSHDTDCPLKRKRGRNSNDEEIDIGDNTIVNKQVEREHAERHQTDENLSDIVPKKKSKNERLNRELRLLQHPKDDMLARELGTFEESECSDDSVDSESEGDQGDPAGDEKDGDSIRSEGNHNVSPEKLKNDAIQVYKKNSTNHQEHAKSTTIDNRHSENDDNDDPPMSEYEQLRLRNIKRNEARLSQLGLLVPTSKKKPTSTRESNSSVAMASSFTTLLSQSSGKQNRSSKGQNKAATAEIERKSLPRRRAKERNDDATAEEKKSNAHSKGNHQNISASSNKNKRKIHEDADQSLQASTKKTKPNHDHINNETFKGERHVESQNSSISGKKNSGKQLVSLVEAAKTGCKKCTDEWQSGKKASVTHDLHCPRRRPPVVDDGVSLVEAAKTGCRKCTLEWQSGKKTNNPHDLDCPRSRRRPSVLDGRQRDEGNTNCSNQEISRKNTPNVSLLEAAKTGCKKCTLEWQTDEEDKSKVHDQSCPRRIIASPKPHGVKKAVSNTTSRPSTGIAKIDQTPPSNSRNAQTRISLPDPQPTARNITPSPALHSTNPPPPPAFIAEFTSKSNNINICNSDGVTAPRGAKWAPCPNPWGEVGHVDGDFVVISPFQSETANVMISALHQGPDGGMPTRFVANPLENNSPYHTTHRSPERGGYSVLRLKRDRMGMKPWGFTVRYHEFGGACLVDSIEPLSSAEGAEDISGCKTANSSSSLQIHDMIICMNGKPVGGMTEVELQIEMDVCGPDLLLVVSRFDVQDSNVASCANNTLEDLAMDWNDVGAGVSSTKKRVSFGASNNQTSLQNDFYEHESCLHFTDTIESQEDECEDPRTEIITTQANTEKSLSMQEKIHQPRRNDERIAVGKISQQNLHDSSVRTNLGLPLTPKKKAKTAANPKRLPSDHNDKQSFHQKSNIAKHKRESAALDKYRKQLEELSDSSESEVEHIKPNHQNRTSTEKRKEKSGSIVVHPERKANPAVNKSHQTAAMGRTRNMYANHKDVAKHQHSSKPKALDRYRKHVDDPSDYSESEDEEPRRNSSTRHYPKPNKTGKENCRRSNGNSKSVDTDYSDESSAINSQEEDENDDENPWLGCVCGRTHPPPIKVFWIQCESCEAWYNVAEGCIGFNSEDANSLEEWSCWACKPPVAGLGL